MANRVLITELPTYPVCTIEEFLSGSSSPFSVVAHANHPTRRIIKLPNKREILVVLHPLTYEIFAMDRFCYHDGYPLENGDMEDIVAVESMEENKKHSTFSSKNEKRGEGQVIPRQKGGLKFNKEEHLRASAKLLQRTKNLLVGDNASKDEIAKKEDEMDIDDILPLIKPGLLEVDYEDPAQFYDDDNYVFPIITCTLHNRIFDLRTGDMISRAVTRRQIKTPNGKHDTDEEEKCLVSQSTGCHQRVHPVVIIHPKINVENSGAVASTSAEKTGEDEGKNSSEDDDKKTHQLQSGMIVVYDTFGYSVAMRRPGAKVNMDDRSHLMFLPKKKVLSDKENKSTAETNVTTQ